MQNLADSEDVGDADDVSDILAETGQSLDDVEIDVADLQQRRGWAALVSPLVGLKQDRDDIADRLAKAEKKADAARQAADELEAELRPIASELDGQLAQMSAVNTKLSKANFAAASRGLGRVEIK